MNKSNPNDTKFYQSVMLMVCFCFSAALISCNKESAPVDVGYDYFPAYEGKWMHYDVDSTVWDDFTSQTYYYHSQILEIIESAFIDGEGNHAFRIERYYRSSDTTEWIIKDVWFANIKPSSAEVVEENVRFIKLCFPVKNNYKWDGNALNFLNDENYIFKQVHEPLSIGNQFYDSTLTVEQSNNINLIEEDIRYENYAKHIGMIKKYIKKVTKNIAQPDVIISGVLVEYNLRNYGQ